MSADNYLSVRHKNGKWFVHNGNASTGNEWPESEHNTRDEAIDRAMEIQSEEIVEYGLTHIDPIQKPGEGKTE